MLGTSLLLDWLAGAGEDCEHDGSEDDDDDDSDMNLEVDPALVQQSLLNTPNSPAFRDWEKYTKVSCDTGPSSVGWFKQQMFSCTAVHMVLY